MHTPPLSSQRANAEAIASKLPSHAPAALPAESKLPYFFAARVPTVGPREAEAAAAAGQHMYAVTDQQRARKRQGSAGAPQMVTSVVGADSIPEISMMPLMLDAIGAILAMFVHCPMHAPLQA